MRRTVEYHIHEPGEGGGWAVRVSLLDNSWPRRLWTGELPGDYPTEADARRHADAVVSRWLAGAPVTVQQPCPWCAAGDTSSADRIPCTSCHGRRVVHVVAGR